MRSYLHFCDLPGGRDDLSRYFLGVWSIDLTDPRATNTALLPRLHRQGCFRLGERCSYESTLTAVRDPQAMGGAAHGRQAEAVGGALTSPPWNNCTGPAGPYDADFRALDRRRGARRDAAARTTITPRSRAGSSGDVKPTTC